MRALGLKRYGIKFLFAVEGVLLGILGSAAGGIIFLAVYYVVTITQPSYIPPASSNPVPLRVDLVWVALMRSLLFMALLSFIAAFIPARRSAKMTIVDALGHV